MVWPNQMFLSKIINKTGQDFLSSTVCLLYPFYPILLSLLSLISLDFVGLLRNPYHFIHLYLVF